MLTEKNSLLEELALTKKLGFALDNEEFVSGTVAIAVPAFDSNKRFVGMFVTHGPKSRMPYEHFWNIMRFSLTGLHKFPMQCFEVLER